MFALLDRAQIGFELKAAVYDAVRTAPDAGAAVLALQGLDLSPVLLGAAQRDPPRPLTRRVWRRTPADPARLAAG